MNSQDDEIYIVSFFNSSSGKTSGSRENLGDSRESIEVEGARSTSSRGRGSKLNSSRESIPDSSSQYANMINMVEWDNGPHREMAVDVPESFVPRNKTPPRYPPTKTSTLTNNNNSKPSLAKTVSGDSVGVRGQNGAAGKPLPPPRDSVNVNNNQVPYVPPRTVVSPTKTAAATATPSRDEAERIRKYQVKIIFHFHDIDSRQFHASRGSHFSPRRKWNAIIPNFCRFSCFLLL